MYCMSCSPYRIRSLLHLVFFFFFFFSLLFVWSAVPCAFVSRGSFPSGEEEKDKVDDIISTGGRLKSMNCRISFHRPTAMRGQVSLTRPSATHRNFPRKERRRERGGENELPGGAKESRLMVDDACPSPLRRVNGTGHYIRVLRTDPNL